MFVNWTRDNVVATSGKDMPEWLIEYRGLNPPGYRNAPSLQTASWGRRIFGVLSAVASSIQDDPEYGDRSDSRSIIPIRMAVSDHTTTADIAERIEKEKTRTQLHTDGKTTRADVFSRDRTKIRPNSIFDAVNSFVTNQEAKSASTQASMKAKIYNAIRAFPAGLLVKNKYGQDAYRFGIEKLNDLRKKKITTQIRYGWMEDALNILKNEIDEAANEKAQKMDAEETKRQREAARQRGREARALNRQWYPPEIDNRKEFYENWPQVNSYLKKILSPFVGSLERWTGPDGSTMPDVAYVGLKSFCLCFNVSPDAPPFSYRYEWIDPDLEARFNAAGQRMFLFGTFARYTRQIMLMDKSAQDSRLDNNTYFKPEFSPKTFTFTEIGRLQLWAANPHISELEGGGMTAFLTRVSKQKDTRCFVGNTEFGTLTS